MVQASEANNFGGMYSKRASKDALAVFFENDCLYHLIRMGSERFLSIKKVSREDCLSVISNVIISSFNSTAEKYLCSKTHKFANSKNI